MEAMHPDTSIVFKFLPQLIQRRVRRIPSLRRSMSWSSKLDTTPIFEPFTPSRPSSSDSDTSCTPPPSYRTSSNFSRSDISPDSIPLDTRHTRHVSATYGTRESGKAYQSTSGIDWKYADQGMKMLDHSLQESWSATATQSSQSFPRQLYIHACTYLLQALPSDMSMEESLSVQNALPQALKDDLAREWSGRELSLRPEAGEINRLEERSRLHRFVAFLILQFFLVVNLLLPYVKLFLGVVYRYERKHRISERVFCAGVQSADSMGKRGLDLSRQICSLNDGKVGQGINELMVWWIRGVTGGIHEGVGEGLTIVGVGSNGAVKRQTIARDVHEVQ